MAQREFSWTPIPPSLLSKRYASAYPMPETKLVPTPPSSSLDAKVSKLRGCGYHIHAYPTTSTAATREHPEISGKLRAVEKMGGGILVTILSLGGEGRKRIVLGESEGRILLPTWRTQVQVKADANRLMGSSWLRERLEGEWSVSRQITISVPCPDGVTAALACIEFLHKKGGATLAKAIAEELKSGALLHATSISSLLKIKHLSEHCALTIQNRINMENVFSAARIGQQLNLSHLLQACYQWIIRELLLPGHLKSLHTKDPSAPRAYIYGQSKLNPWKVFSDLWSTTEKEGYRFGTTDSKQDTKCGEEVYDGIFYCDSTEETPVFVFAQNRKNGTKIDLEPIAFAHKVKGHRELRLYSQNSVTVVGTVRANENGGFTVYGPGVEGIDSGLNEFPGLFPASARRVLAHISFENQDLVFNQSAENVRVTTYSGPKSRYIFTRYLDNDLGAELKASIIRSNKNFHLVPQQDTFRQQSVQSPVHALSCGKMSKGTYRVKFRKPLALTQGFGIILSIFHRRSMLLG